MLRLTRSLGKLLSTVLIRAIFSQRSQPFLRSKFQRPPSISLIPNVHVSLLHSFYGNETFHSVYFCGVEFKLRRKFRDVCQNLQCILFICKPRLQWPTFDKTRSASLAFSLVPSSTTSLVYVAWQGTRPNNNSQTS